MLPRQILTLLALGFVSQPAYPLALDKRDNAQPATPQSTLPQSLTDFVEGLRTKYGIPSVGIATVSRANQSAQWQSATGAFGTANVQGDPVTAESLFSIASNTKLITAVSIGMLIENGTKLPDGTPLGWNTKMKRIFPNLAWPTDTQTELLDIADLLSMRSGQPRHDFALANDGYEHLIESMPHVKPSAEIRQTWQYSNWHYLIASGIVPTLTGVSFEDFVQQNIFTPLNMTSAGLNATVASQTGLWTDGSMRVGVNLTACGVELRTGKLDEACLGSVERFGKWTDTDGLSIAGAGGAILDLNDMVKWVAELLDPKVLTQSVIDKAAYGYSIIQPTAEFPEYSAQIYGLSQVSFSYRGHQVVTHTGGLPGQNSLLLRLPNDNFGFMMATNEQLLNTPLMTTIVSSFLDDHLGLEPIDWETRLFSALGVGGSTEAPSNTTVIPGPSQDAVVGTYEHPVYGVLALQSLGGGNGSWLSSLGLDTNGTYVAQLDKLFANYVVFTHYSENVFNWTAAYIKNALNADRSINATVAGIVTSGSGSAVINEQGIGMFGDFWGGGLDVPIVQAEIGMQNVKESAEVWFDKTG